MLVFTLAAEVNQFIWGLDIQLYSIKNYPDVIDEINKFLAKDLGSSLEFVYPQLLLTVKWKFDYIVCGKLKREK